MLARWEVYIKEGLKKEDYESIMKKYSCIKEFQAPLLNELIASMMKGPKVTRDGHLGDIQKLAGTALSVVSSLATSIYREDETLTLESMLTSLCDIAKFLSLIIYKQSKSRKALIEPGLSDDMKDLVKNTKVDEYLYGKDLSEKVNQKKTMKKLANELKVTQNQKTSSANVARSNLNSKTPFVRRPLQQMGYTFTGGHLKQKPFFKKPQQQQQQMNNRYQPAQQKKNQQYSGNRN